MGDGSRLAQAHQLPERGRLEGALAGEDFVEDQTQRVDVAPGGDLLARQLLRSNWRASKSPPGATSTRWVWSSTKSSPASAPSRRPRSGSWCACASREPSPILPRWFAISIR